MTDEQAKPPRRWLVPALLVSLAVNLLIVGVVVGFVVSPKASNLDHVGGSTRSLIGAPFVRALPQDDRQALMKAIGAERGRLRENREALRARFEALLGALNADPFDPEAVAKLLQEQRTVAIRRQQIGESLLIERLKSMTPAERADYSDRLAHALRRLRRD
ncbi:MAG: periplasmic heavy metal sensor [Boseongicola sp.]